MNPTWTDASDWLDIVDHLWIGVVAIFIAAVPSWFAHRAGHKAGAKLDSVIGQVVNGHSDAPPLRADIDRANTAIEAVSHEVRGLRQDVADERVARRDMSQDLREDLARHREATARQLDAIMRRLPEEA